MTNNEIEKRIQQVITDNTPNVLDDVFQKCSNQKVEVLKVGNNIKYGNFVSRIALTFATVLLIFVGVMGYNFNQRDNRVASIVSLDVNPSVLINVNAKEKVLDVIANNEDAVKIIEDMDFKGSDIKVAINALIGSMLRHGYLSDIANSLLISVENDDLEKAKSLQDELMLEIDKFLKTDTFDGSVISQTLDHNNEINKLADEYNISKGKAQLIQQIVENKEGRYSFSDLTNLSINELNVINNKPLTNANKTGDASKKAYIGEDSAKQKAYEHANVKASDVKYVSLELEVEDGEMVYEVEFNTTDAEYDYEINAVDGSVVKFEKEVYQTTTASKPQTTTQSNNSASLIGDAKAKDIALKHAGVTNPTNLKVKLDGNKYEVEFKANGYEYDYDINAYNGNIIKSEKELDDDAKTSSNTQTTQTSTPTTTTSPAISQAPLLIGEAKAQSIALGHAGVSNATIIKVELDGNKYEVEFKVSGYEYEYEVDAYNGNILKHEKEQDQSASKPQTTNSNNQTANTKPTSNQQQTSQTNTTQSSNISADKAKSIALNHASVSNPTELKVELDGNKYEVEFKANGYEYEYEIALNGNIIKADKDIDD